MKQAIAFILSLVLLCSLAVPAMAAAGEAIVYTSDSSFVAGGTVKVDKEKTMANIYSNGTSDEYNAFLEGRVQYYWMRNDSYYADGMTLTLTENDKGCQFYCVAALYSDADHTQQCGTLYSEKFTVPNTGNPALIPEITTETIPNGTVGEAYYQKLECTDPDVVFTLFRSSLPDGLYLTQHGEIEGTPTKAGFWYVVVMANPEAGSDYATTAEYEITISEAGPQYTLELIQAPNKTTYTAGEKLDMTGLRVRIYTPDGYLDSRDGKYLTYSKNALTTIGEQKIKISYEDAVEFFIVTVIAAPTEPTTKPTEEPISTTQTPTEAPTETRDKDATETSTVPQNTEPPEDTAGKDVEKNETTATAQNSHNESTNNNKNSTDNNPIIIVVIALAAVVAVLICVIVFMAIKRLKQM